MSEIKSIYTIAISSILPYRLGNTLSFRIDVDSQTWVNEERSLKDFLNDFIAREIVLREYFNVEDICIIAKEYQCNDGILVDIGNSLNVQFKQGQEVGRNLAIPK
jgi:hypothetical protein